MDAFSSGLVAKKEFQKRDCRTRMLLGEEEWGAVFTCCCGVHVRGFMNHGIGRICSKFVLVENGIFHIAAFMEELCNQELMSL